MENNLVRPADNSAVHDPQKLCYGHAIRLEDLRAQLVADDPLPG
jgi:hypothetical protein